VIVEAKAFVLRRNWLPVIVCVGLLVGGLLAGRADAFQVWLSGYFAAFFGFVFAPVLFLRNSFPRATPAIVRATTAGLFVDDEEVARSEDILEAKVLPRAGLDAVVELALRGKAKALSLRARKEDANAIIQVLGARRTRFRLVQAYWKRFLATSTLLSALTVFVARGDLDRSLPALPGVLFYAALIAWMVGVVRGRLVVGADGFTTRWLFRERFIAFRDVAAVRKRPRIGGNVEDTLVELKSGRKVRLRTVEAPNTEEERGSESRAMFAYVSEAFAHSTRLQDGTVNVPSLVERGARSAREWLYGIDALVRGGGSRYRVAAVSADMLASLTSDPNASIESRVGAAAALVRMGDESQRTRVRIAAEACADSDLRQALLALSEAHDDDATAAALASLRPQEQLRKA
jgi:hypothetical protein